MRKMNTENILNYQVTTDTVDKTIARVLSWITSPKTGCYLACANPHSIAVSFEDRLFEKALMMSDLLVPDGVGIILASRFLGGKIRQRITGSDIFFTLHRELDRQGGFSVFFLGSTAETLDNIRTKMSRDYPRIRVAGTYAPPYKPEFSDEDNRLMIEKINQAKPDVLWVGMTAPKQEKWIYQNRDRLNVKFIGAIGAVFDFYTGKVKRSHPVFQRLGLEWLPRLIQEPRRLWRRNFISGPMFLAKVIVCRVKKNRLLH